MAGMNDNIVARAKRNDAFRREVHETKAEADAAEGH